MSSKYIKHDKTIHSFNSRDCKEQFIIPLWSKISKSREDYNVSWKKMFLHMYFGTRDILINRDRHKNPLLTIEAKNLFDDPHQSNESTVIQVTDFSKNVNGQPIVKLFEFNGNMDDLIEVVFNEVFSILDGYFCKKKRRVLAFMQGSHKRLIENSYLRLLNNDNMKSIWKHV